MKTLMTTLLLAGGRADGGPDGHYTCSGFVHHRSGEGEEASP